MLLQLGFAAVSLTLVSSFWYRMTDGVFLKLVNINKFNSMSWFVGYYFFIMVIAYLFLNKFLAKLDKQKYFYLSDCLICIYPVPLDRKYGKFPG